MNIAISGNWIYWKQNQGKHSEILWGKWCFLLLSLSPYEMEPGPMGQSEKRKENNINYRIVEVNEQHFVLEAEQSCETIICG